MDFEKLHKHFSEGGDEISADIKHYSDKNEREEYNTGRITDVIRDEGDDYMLKFETEKNGTVYLSDRVRIIDSTLDD